MTEGQKINHLLEFMARTGEYDWTSKMLMPAFNNLLNEHEIEYLCLILIDNGDVNDTRTKDGFSIGFNSKSKSAFHGQKYLKEPPTIKQQVTIGSIQQNYGTIHGNMSQSSDSSSNKSSIPGTTNKRNILKIVSIIIGVIVGLVSIVYYIIEIMTKK